MQIHTFRAESLQAALQQVRDALGPDAAVLQTREKRPGRLRLFAKTVVEVEATLDVPIASYFADTAQATDRSRRSTRQASSGLGERAAILPNSQAASQHSNREASATDATMVSTGNPGRDMASEAMDARTSDCDLKAPSAAMLEVQADLLASGMTASLVATLMREAAERGPDHSPAETAKQMRDPWALRGRIGQCIAKRLKVAGSIELSGDKPRIVALVGPTGAGKTTTLAKIAASFRVDLGCRIGIVTLDTCRLGAVDQLLQYAELVSAPLEVVSSPDQVTAALQRLSDCDLVLLDTAGRAPRDAQQLTELRRFLELAQPHSVQLVVSATSSAAHAAQALDQFSTLVPTSLLITKLDEAVDFGSWLPLFERTSLAISYLTYGQQVPQDIMVASARRLSSLMLGQTPHRSENSPSPNTNRLASL